MSFLDNLADAVIDRIDYRRKLREFNREEYDQKVWSVYDAAIKGDMKYVKENIDLKDFEGNTLLHWATLRGFLDFVKFLVENGADTCPQNHNGDTPLHLASLRDYKVYIVNYLIEKGADINSLDKHQKTPLYLASFYGNFNIVKCLVEHGADVNSSTYLGDSPLSRAIEQEHFGVAFYLVENGANLNIFRVIDISFGHLFDNGLSFSLFNVFLKCIVLWIKKYLRIMKGLKR